jgi:uncharacterized membrane protein YbhN (UPF0104 family)
VRSGFGGARPAPHQGEQSHQGEQPHQREPPAARRPRWRTAVSWAVPVGVLCWVLSSWTSLDQGTDLLGQASMSWLAAAGGFAVLMYVAGAACQQGSVLDRLPVHRLLAVQVAASCASHFSMAHVGGGYVNFRFLRRHGLTRAEAAGAVTLNTAANFVTHVLVLFLVLALVPGTGGLRSLHLPLWGQGGLIALGVVVGVVALLLSRGGVRRAVARRLALLRPLGPGLLAVCRHPVRAVQLWGGALAMPVLHAAVLASVLRALGSSIPLGAVLVAYLASSAVSAAVPAPGGLGALDVTLSLALAGAGGDAGLTVAAVIGYRLMTTWLPLVPSALTLGILLRRRIV